MSELGDLLALLHRGGEDVRTVRGVIRTWTHEERAHAAWQADAEASGGTFVVFAYGDEDAGPQPEERVTVTRLWRAFPGLARTEGDDSLGVRRDETWWTWRRGEGATTNEGEELQSDVGTEFDHLFAPGRLMGALRLEFVERTRRAGRDVVLARAVPRPATAHGPRDWALHDLGMGADEYVLAVDADCGVLLEVVSRRAGEDFARTEVLEIAFDVDLDAALFVFEAPDGTTAAAPQHEHVEWHVSAAEIAQRAPFAVFLPAEVPAGWRVQGTYREDHPAAWLHYEAPDGATRMTIDLQPADAPPERHDALDTHDAWTEVGREGVVYQVRAPTETWASRLVRVNREGTRILLASGELDTDALLDVAMRLVRIEPGPARFA